MNEIDSFGKFLFYNNAEHAEWFSVNRFSKTDLDASPVLAHIEAILAKLGFQAHNQCLFCNIINSEVPVT